MRRAPLLIAMLAAALAWPIAEQFLPGSWSVLDAVKSIFIFAILGLALNAVTGFAGILNLGIAAFMAIGAYAFAILTNDLYPFQIGFWPAILLTLPIGALAGFLLGAPTLGLRGDYLAIVTLGFGEIVQDVLKNLDSITLGTQGINPLPAPVVPWWKPGEDGQGGGLGLVDLAEETQGAGPLLSYYLFLAFVVVAWLVFRNLERSRVGRAWMSLRSDELASRSMGIPPVRTKMLAFATAAAFAAFAGGLWASWLSSTGEPANYDFQISILALCIVIVGGMGSIAGVLVGALVMIGVNSIVLVKLFEWLQSKGLGASGSVFVSPNSWKYLLFGLALVLMMRFKPDGLVPASGRGERKPSGGRS
ncbi:MAG: branched-chain amino acid ABC transporter permease [Phycisphaerae bacterium]|nr:branched-chain amino acid ABC transporter permease [Phycisphaerae bacterium]